MKTIGRVTRGGTPRLARALALVLVFVFDTAAFAALPGVTEFRTTPEAIPDTQLSTLLDARIASAEVVALGETVHGSSGLLRMQARLIRYLVEKHGFRLIVWETATLRSLQLSNWVSSCTKAKSPPPVDVLYFPTKSDVPLFEWICDFNRAHPDDPVVFRGIDIWDRPWEHYARIRTLTERLGFDETHDRDIKATCPGHGLSSWPEIDAMLGPVSHHGRFFAETDYEKCRAALDLLLSMSRTRAYAMRWKNHPGFDDAFELTISTSTILGWLGFFNYNWSDDVVSWNERDRAQAMNLWLVMDKHKAERAIVAAHTSHVSHSRSPADWWGFGDIKSAVSFYRRLTRRTVFNIALTAYEASGVQGHWSLPTARNSLDKKLFDSGHRFSFFASDAAFVREHPKWWIQNQNYPGPYESGVELVLPDHFDAFFAFERSLLDEALPARPMWQP